MLHSENSRDECLPRSPHRGRRTNEEPAVDERYAELERAVSVSGLLGYLNFSDGRPDPRWQKQLNDAYAFFAQRGEPRPWLALLEGLKAGLDKLHAGGSSAFRDVRQAAAALT